MPKYDYRCQQCGDVYEKREGFDAPAVQTCPRCSGLARRVLTPPAIVFKGTGWYSTDNRKSGNGSARADGGAKSDEKSEGTSSSESANSTPSASSAEAESKPAVKASADE